MNDATPGSSPRGVLHLVISGAPAPEGLPALVKLCQADGWQVAVFATPTGLQFADTASIEHLTGAPVRSEYRAPGDARPRVRLNEDGEIIGMVCVVKRRPEINEMIERNRR